MTDAAMDIETVVVVGAGQAGGWAVHTLRKEAFAGRIVLVGDEPHPPHERPPLSKAVLAGDASSESTYILKPDVFEQLALDWRPATRVTAIDRAAKRVALDHGEPIRYDKLILCTGGRARTLEVPGAELPGIFTLRTIDDALAVRPILRPGAILVVVGGGWIGLEVAASARKRGADVTVVEALPRLCQRTVPPEISEYLLTLHTDHGTQVIFGTGVERFARGSQRRLVVVLSDGRQLECDEIVVGVGLVPNDELARHAGLDCDGGVLVDAACRTSDPDIFAAGDVAVTPSPWAGRPIRLESWQNAQEQGIAAARSALGIDTHYEILPWFWSDQYDMNLQIYGVPMASHRVVVRGEPDSGSFVVFYLDGELVKAAMGPNAARDLRFARRLIERQKPVDAQRLADTVVPLSKL